MFSILKTHIDGLDAILGGGIRYPSDSTAFAFITGGPGTGKTLLALEMATRAWLHGEDGTTHLYYSVEHTPDSLLQKLEFDFEFYGETAEIRPLEREVPHKLCLEAVTERGVSRFVLTQAHPASLEKEGSKGTAVDVDWILAEIGNHKMAGKVEMACIDNVGLLLTDLDYFTKRTRLLETRRTLALEKIHGVFVMEETHERDLRIPSAEEFSADLLVRLSLTEQRYGFKARGLEIQKARHQYYYRGVHHFSIAGKGITRDVYLGARNERGPGIHIYPSVAAQLSIARDRAVFRVPERGSEVIDLGQAELNSAFLSGTGPCSGSSTVLLAEPGTRSTLLALRFLAAAKLQGERTLFVSTKEDRDSLRRICARDEDLAHCITGERSFHAKFRVLYLHPEFISPGKFTWDLIRLAEGGHGDKDSGPVTRLAFDNTYRLEDRFPLITNEQFLVPALLDLLRYRNVTTFFVDLVPPGSAQGKNNFDPSGYMTGFDTVLHMYLEEGEWGTRPFVRVLKSAGNDFTSEPFPLDYQKPRAN